MSPSPTVQPLLDVQALTVKFGGLVAVNGVDFQIHPGEIVSVIGPNGAGKTTIFNAITGVYEPAGGRIVFGDRELRRALRIRTGLGLALVGLGTAAGLTLMVNLENVWEAAITAHYQYRQPFPWIEAARSFLAYFAGHAAARVAPWFLAGAAIGTVGATAVWQRGRRAPDVVARRGIARTFQNIRLFQEMTALDNVLIGMDHRLQTGFWHAALRLPLFWREHRAALPEAGEILKFVGLEHEAGELAENLSYGHQRRLEIARALATNPSLLLLDEPAAGMNPSEALDLMQLIRRIRDRGITVVLIEHQMSVVMGISDRIIVLDYGEKIAEGTPGQVSNDPRVIEAYLGKRYEDAPAA